MLCLRLLEGICKSPSLAVGQKMAGGDIVYPAIFSPILALSDPRAHPGRDRGLAGSGSFDQQDITRARLHSETADAFSSALTYSLHTGPLAYLEVTVTCWRVSDEANRCLWFVPKVNLGNVRWNGVSPIYDNGN